jgi:hypothetical protein
MRTLHCPIAEHRPPCFRGFHATRTEGCKAIGQGKGSGLLLLPFRSESASRDRRSPSAVSRRIERYRCAWETSTRRSGREPDPRTAASSRADETVKPPEICEPVEASIPSGYLV